MISQAEYNPEVFSGSEELNDLVQIRCDHPRLSLGYFDHDDFKPAPASCPKCHDRMTKMATLFLQTCPDSWSRGFGPGLRGMLSRAIQKNECIDIMDVGDAITFRWKAMQLVDRIIKELNLPIPSNKTCALWSPYRWRTADRKDDQHPYYARDYNRLWAAIRGKDLPEPSPHQGPPFVHIHEYLAASITETRLPEQEASALVKLVLEHVHHAKQCDSDLNYQYKPDKA